MARLSKIYKFRKKSFRYDYDNGLVSVVYKADEEMYKDNEEWQEKYGKDLWDIDKDGYIESSTVGLMRENWDNKEVRDEYLSMWVDELKEEAEYLAQEFLMYG